MPATTAIAMRLSLRTGAAVEQEGAGVAVRVGRVVASFPDAAGVGPVLDAIAAGVAEDALRAHTLEVGGVQGLYRLQQLLGRLDAVAVLARTLVSGDEPVITFEPLSGQARLATAPAAAPRRLSRFTVMHREEDDVVIESPTGHARVRLHAAGLRLLPAIAAGPDRDALAAAMDGDTAAAGRVMDMLWSAGALDDDATLPTWQLHDLFFHMRSRLGRHTGGYGGTFRFNGVLPQPPALRPPASTLSIALEAPDIEELAADDVPFTAVLEGRRSIREQGDEPMTLAQLSEFLFRTVRVTAHHRSDRGEVTQRLYPAGGALYELEVWPVVDRCAGLDAGLYRYDPLAHALEPVSGRTPEVQALLDNAFHTADRRSRPQLMLAVTARFHCMQWKYEGMAYAAILKHVGVLYQTFYLVAEAMQLAPCALGGGDSDLFARAAGLDPLEESTVGEFILGSRQAAAHP
jgi:oxazoline/thiazoline dehydrogenase